METKIKTWAFDIQEAVESIEMFIQDKKDIESFGQDLKTKRAVERELEIIGEAVDWINKLDSDIEISNLRQIINMRNKIIHGYETVSDTVLWVTIHNSLPQLKKEIQKILQRDCSQDMGL
jgi:uncharacterized protein with HEPN domain